MVFNRFAQSLPLSETLSLLLWVVNKTALYSRGKHYLWKILKEMGIPDHLTCPLRNLDAGEEATVRIGQSLLRLVPNRKRSTSRLYIVTLLI